MHQQTFSEVVSGSGTGTATPMCHACTFCVTIKAVLEDIFVTAFDICILTLLNDDLDLQRKLEKFDAAKARCFLSAILKW